MALVAAVYIGGRFSRSSGGTERSGPRVRAGTIAVPDAHRKGRIPVILTLADPPLAAYSLALRQHGDAPAERAEPRREAYVAKLRSAQRRAAVSLKRAIPSAAVKRNYTVLLNGMAVDLPATELAKAASSPSRASSARATATRSRSTAAQA